MSAEGGRREFAGHVGIGKDMEPAYLEPGKKEPEHKHEMGAAELKDELVNKFKMEGAEARALREDSQYWSDIDRGAVEMAINGPYDAKTYEKWKKESNREALQNILYRAFKEYQN